MRTVLLPAVAVLLLAPYRLAPTAQRPHRDEAIERLVESGRHPDLRWPDLRDVQVDLARLYQRHGWAPIWQSNDTLTTPAQTLLRILREAEFRGLDREDYDVSWLEGQLAVTRILGGATEESRARLDVALSVSAARFALALRRGRVSPTAVHVTFKLPADSFDVAATLDTLTTSPWPGDVMRGLEPPFLQYWLLLASLVRYQALSRDSALVVLPPMPRQLRPGSAYGGVPTLRRLLRLLGDDRDTTSAPLLDTLYDGGVVEALKRFQIRQGFPPDGVIGDSTRGRLSSPFGPRIRQMELTLERWRWMPRTYSASPLFVNIPAFRLYAFSAMRNDETSLLGMNVVVGQAFQNETPVFAADMGYLVFSPYWDVTPTIALNEIKPAALRDPEFLTRNRYELVEGGGVVLPWRENVERIGQGVRVRQVPGAHNALGGVKFIMPNENNIYLHDTPSRTMFERTRRDASHGCIRLGDPFALAKFVLHDQPDWTDERIRAAMTAEVAQRVDLTHPIPVFIIYSTAVARENGDLFFYPDIYGHDRTLDRLLRKGYPYPRR
ncbi:MAG: L,D-transpeptidase family protein [Gemmatimonadales bacterium]